MGGGRNDRDRISVAGAGNRHDAVGDRCLCQYINHRQRRFFTIARSRCPGLSSIDDVQVLTVKIAAVADGSVVWSKAYPGLGADPTKIAREVEAKIPPLDN